MRILLLYDTTSGVTKQLARVISVELGNRASVQTVPLSQAGSLEIIKADLLIIGAPTEQHSLSPAAQVWLTRLPHGALDGMPTAVFATRYHRAEGLTSAAARTLAKELERRGATLLASPMIFFAQDREGPFEPQELARAVEWARKMAALTQAQLSTPVDDSVKP